MGDPARTREALLGVLVRLGRETREVKVRKKGLTETRLVPKPLDLALVHWPAKAGAAPDDASHFVARRDAWRVLERARDAGYVRAIGVSNYTRAHLEEMRFYAEKHLPCVNQVELHPRCQQKELRAACAELRVGVVAYSPLGCGALLEDPRVVRCAARLAAELGTSHPVTPAQALLAWSLRQNGVVAAVCKSSDPARAAANVGTGGIAFALRLAELSDAAFRELDEMDDGTHFCWDPSVVR
jgi:diketogulonate reductase-like aldo/keto reductase